jgi:hypothetical protein
MSERNRREEKDEKEEKRHEKDEKGRSDPLSGVVWGAIIVWAGLVLLAGSLGVLPTARGPEVPGALPGRLEPWTVIFIGAGVILLIEAAVREVIPTYRRPVGGTVILALIFLGIGFGNWIGWNVIWPLILIAIGVLILLRGFGWRR